MTTTAGLDRFARVITTKRNDHCKYCGQPTRTGVDFAAVTASGKWSAVCATCATSITAQCAGMVRQIQAADVKHADGTTLANRCSEDIAMPHLQAVLSGSPRSDAQAYDTLVNLGKVLTRMREAKVTNAQASALTDPLMDALRHVADSEVSKPRDRAFAASLLRWRGPLTDRQRAAAENMLARIAKDAHQAVIPDVAPGLYQHDDGMVRRIYRRSGHLTSRTYDGTTFQPEGPQGVAIVHAALEAGTAHRMTEQEASRWGRQHGKCFNCLMIGRPGDLSDDRSLAVGYGPDCAEHHGWYYPTAEEAARILRPSV